MQTVASVDTRQLLSDAKFYEAYSRYDESLGRYETWEEAVDRVISMHEKVYFEKNNELKGYIEEARIAYKEKLVLGAQRALQFGGEQILKHQMKMYNCTSSYADRAEFFGEIFYILLCGAGAGFSVQKHHVAKLPQIAERKKQPKTHVIEDSIEGWATAADVLLSSYFVGGGKYPEYEGRKVYFDFSQIRPKGAFISGGFKAPGPDGLRLALDRIEHLLQHILIIERTNTLRPIHVYDMVMHEADAVLSGGVRRSATICLFSIDDEEMLNAKTGDWFNTNPQRGRSNNSAVVVRSEATREQFAGIMGKIKEFGEPGFVFVDSTEHTTNPCVEIGMYPQIDGQSGWQGCNLTEINGGQCDTEERFYQACRAAAILGTLQAGYTNFKFLSETTRKIFEREALIGCSITGWMNNPHILFDEKILRKGAEIVRKTNEEVAAIIGVNVAARTTCVKPSGTASILLMTASGIHAEHGPRYIRNVQMNKNTEVAQLLATSNPAMVEDSVWSATGTDYVVSFPIVPKDGSLFKDDYMGVKHLEKIKLVQQSWIEAGTNVERCVDPRVRHNVSNTIIVDDWEEIENYIYENRQYFAGISFMAAAGDKAYNQAPNTAVLTENQIVDKYGVAGILASGLIVDGLDSFNNLWDATYTARFNESAVSVDSRENSVRRDWVRRFKNFATNYLDGDLEKAEHCLKDVYLLHKWEKIQKNFKPISWEGLGEKEFVDVDTLAAAACQGGQCEIF